MYIYVYIKHLKYSWLSFVTMYPEAQLSLLIFGVRAGIRVYPSCNF